MNRGNHINKIRSLFTQLEDTLPAAFGHKFITAEKLIITIFSMVKSTQKLTSITTM